MIVLRGVSRVVTGRRREGTRVKYDATKGRGTSERIVMERCRKARYGCLRLPPAIWRAIGQLQDLERQHPNEGLAELLHRLGPARPRLMRVGLVKALRAAILPARVATLVARHSGGEVDPRRPGVPDLFVFKQRADQPPFAVRFVEVKRPDEPLAPHQREELVFMRAMGLRAGVLRLREAGR